jgi:hypothetical protein
MQLRAFVRASLALAGFALSPSNAEAQATPPEVTFDAVTAYTLGQVYNGYIALTVTGVQHGASGPSTVGFTISSPDAQSLTLSTCERQLLVAINRPGRFSVALSYGGAAPPSTGTGTTSLSSRGCRLTQLP